MVQTIHGLKGNSLTWGFQDVCDIFIVRHWVQKAYRKAEHRITRGKYRVPCLKIDVVCDLDLIVWSLFCGFPRMLNDLNIL